MASVVVAGGGLAGLSAARRLGQAGHDVVVLEAEPEAGGRMRAERHGDFVLDRGAQFVSSAYPNLRRLIAELGLEDRVRPLRDARNAILRDGKLHEAAPDSPLGILRSPLLSATAMNSPGSTARSPSRRRTSASAPTMRPVARSTCGWK